MRSNEVATEAEKVVPATEAATEVATEVVMEVVMEVVYLGTR